MVLVPIVIDLINSTFGGWELKKLHATYIELSTSSLRETSAKNTFGLQQGIKG